MKKKNKTKKKNIKKSSKANQKNIVKKRKIILLFLCIIILLSITLGILFSSLFNIKSIIVINNSKVSQEEIIQNSGLLINENMFKTSKRSIKNAIKQNPYIENVKIKKKLNGEVVIEIEERVATYMLEQENNFAYINNQGYILEISAEAIQLPIIRGYETQELTPGSRLDKKDLEKLNTIIQIMNTADNKGIKELITAFDISDKNNFKLEISSENKIVHFGGNININEKILWIIDILEKTKDEEGEIVLNDSDIKKAYFREKI